MKANAPKRKVFADAMDLLTENASGAENDIQMIITSVDTLAFDEEFLKNVDIVKISQGKILQ